MENTKAYTYVARIFDENIKICPCLGGQNLTFPLTIATAQKKKSVNYHKEMYNYS